MEKKAKLTIYILIIAILVVVLVKYVIPGESLNGIWGVIDNGTSADVNMNTSEQMTQINPSQETPNTAESEIIYNGDNAWFAVGESSDNDTQDGYQYKTDDDAYQTKNTSEFKKGILTTNSFSSEYMGLSFTLPYGYIMASQDDIYSMLGVASNLYDINPLVVEYARLTTAYEMMAFSPSGIPNVIVMSEKLLLSNMTLEQYFDTLKLQLKNMGYSFQGDMKTLQIVGQSYQQCTASHNITGQYLMQDYILRKQGDRVNGFIITYTPDTVSERDTLLNAFSPYNTGYVFIIDKMYKAIDEQDTEMYLSIIPFDYFTSNGYNTRDMSALKDFFSDKFMPKYNIDPNYRTYTDEIITDYEYTIDLLKEYDNDGLKILAKSLEADEYYPLKANTLKDAVLISVKEYCVNGRAIW